MKRSLDSGRFAGSRLLATACLGLAGTAWVHGPVAVEACSTCHDASPTAAAPHAFAPVADQRDLCFSCHEIPPADEGIHEPFGSANCTGCHDPHGGAEKNFLRTTDVAALCTSCHASDTVAVPHQPQETGDCLSCHESHSSRHEHLLIQDESELCTGCHKEYRSFRPENLLAADMVEHMHPAVLAEGCLACHQAHGSQRPALMRAELHDTCRRCHTELHAGLDEAVTVHGAFAAEDSCTSCHTPHASPYDGLLSAPPEELCLSCHDEPQRAPDGHMITSVTQQLADAEVVHHPVAEGDCTACHIAHFSPQRSLLAESYPNKIYAAFTGGSYELCFQCHDRTMVSEDRTSRTGFRDGELNLHRLHVNSEKGRACDICHDPHAAGYRLIRETYPFGPSRWPLPLGFVLGEAGGSCTSACHEFAEYRR